MYCASCRTSTQNGKRPSLVQTASGRSMVRTTCASCGTNKQQFAAGSTIAARRGTQQHLYSKPTVAQLRAFRTQQRKLGIPVARPGPRSQASIRRLQAPKAQKQRMVSAVQARANRARQLAAMRRQQQQQDDYSDDEDSDGSSGLDDYGVGEEQIIAPQRRAPIQKRPLPPYNGNNIASFRQLPPQQEEDDIDTAPNRRVPRKPHAATTQKWQRQLDVNPQEAMTSDVEE